MNLKEALKGFKRDGFGEEERKKKVALKEADVLDWKEYEDKVVIVTIFGQKYIKIRGISEKEEEGGSEEENDTNPQEEMSNEA